MSYSVIVPVYNAEKSIRRCLNSIINAVEKSQQEVEIVLVNDGSVDNSGFICCEYSKQYFSDRIRVVCHNQENAGPSAARNVGLSIATGEYIVFVDSDDYITDDFFTTLESLPDADLLEFDCIENDDVVEDKGALDCRTISVNEIVSSRSGAVWSKRFKRDIIRKYEIVFPPDLTIGEDVVFGLHYSVNAGTIIKTNARLYGYDQSQTGSLTRHYKADACDQAMRIYAYEFGVVKKSDLSDKEKYEIFKLLDYNYCRTMFVDVEELFRRKPRFSAREFFSEEKAILSRFNFQKEKWYRPTNISHLFMQACVMWKLGFIVLIVSSLHYGWRFFSNKKKIYG